MQGLRQGRIWFFIFLRIRSAVRYGIVRVCLLLEGGKDGTRLST